MLLVLLILAFVLGGTLFSFKGAGMSYLTNIDGKVTEVNMIMHILELCGLQCISLIMMVTLAFMISTVFRNSAMAIGIGVFLFTVGSSITMLLASRYTWAKFILFANTDLTQYISGEPLITGMTMTFSIIVLIVYFMSFNVISYLGFKTMAEAENEQSKVVERIKKYQEAKTIIEYIKDGDCATLM